MLDQGTFCRIIYFPTAGSEIRKIIWDDLVDNVLEYLSKNSEQRQHGERYEELRLAHCGFCSAFTASTQINY